MHRYLLFQLFLLFACNKLATISINEAIKYLENEEYYFLDVRTKREHLEKSILNTDCIPVQEIEERIEELEKYKDKKLIVYCRSGNRSKVATEILIQNGYDGYNLIGGMNKWNGKIESGK